MAFIKVNALFVVVFLAAACPLNAQILNGSFEDFVGTDVNNWTFTGALPPQQPQSTYLAQNRLSIEPNEGEYFVVLKSEAKRGEQNCTQLSQIVDVNAGETLTGVYFFDAEDYLPYDDTAIITLHPVPEDPCSGPSEILLAHKRISDPDIGDYGSMQCWEMFSHTFNHNDAGRYMLALRIENVDDRQLDSFLLVDNVRIVPGVPLPVCNYVLVGDINDDCKVDFLDFAKMAEHWMIDCNTEPRDDAVCIHK